MDVKKYFFVISLGLFLSCGSSRLMEKSLMINPEQSKEDVIKVLGPPGDRQFKGKNEAWQWCTTGIPTDDFLVVWFYDGKVTGITTYKNSKGRGICDRFYRTIRWADAPDHKIEIRNR